MSKKELDHVMFSKILFKFLYFFVINNISNIIFMTNINLFNDFIKFQLKMNLQSSLNRSYSSSIGEIKSYAKEPNAIKKEIYRNQKSKENIELAHSFCNCFSVMTPHFIFLKKSMPALNIYTILKRLFTKIVINKYDVYSMIFLIGTILINMNKENTNHIGKQSIDYLNNLSEKHSEEQ